MEEGLADMGVVPLDKNDVEILTAESCSEPPHELKTSRPTANDHYLRLHSCLPGRSGMPLNTTNRLSAAGAPDGNQSWIR
jgi:hypothetical protein